MLNKDQFADNHFIRTIIEEDLKSGKHEAIQTRFPPEPNGYLHIGHAKSICLNFGLAYIYDGLCNLRFDDTNPEKENDEYVNAIKEDVEWLGFHWAGEPRFASNYFDQLYDYAVGLIKEGKADAVLAASIFHFGEVSIRDAKLAMREAGIEVRL